ncbi:MerR family DNA-binding transcriptional regulator [Martelella alba]|uniref:MerR family DNA-binding transcriptional regulator n=1 Tax=Martelella alba TaxID=2590451 RepID=A0A506U7M4_9HYPH|nr:MerR family DNA-binding transcriptional regulator [Martelella alba]TPW29084.1 MerR family DNA-binding transcriptional regulator [Martelella alba]
MIKRYVTKRFRVTDQFYTVTQLADELGLTARAVRFYEVKGLISPGRAGKTRIYTSRDRARLILILRGKRLGFSLQEIKEFLDLYEIDRTQKEQLTALQKAVQSRIALLEDQKIALDLTLSELKQVLNETEIRLSDRSAKDQLAS